MSDLTGKTLDKYKLVRLIGEGGMGNVYEGEHVILGRSAAVKVMHSEYLEREGSVERFQREAQAASAIGHPNIIEVLDIGPADDGTVFMVMELLDGESLEDVLGRLGKLAADRSVAIVLQVLSALNAAHAMGIIHRDLKPANVFIATDKRGREEVKLLDFGVAKVLDTSLFDTALTAPGAILGTPNYISPEQARGSKDIDHRIDLWSAGVMLFEMLTGELPFPGNTYNEVLGMVLLEPHPDLHEKLEDAPDGLCSAIDRALAKERDDRYSSASEMMQDLVHLKGEALSLITAKAAGLIRSSIPPPPASQTAAGLGEAAVNVPTEDLLEQAVSASQSESLPSAASAEWHPRQQPAPASGSRKRPAVIVATVLVALIALVAVTLAVWEEEEALPQAGAGTGGPSAAKAAGEGDVGAWLAQGLDEIAGKAAEEIAAGAAAESDSAEVTTPSTVTVDLEGLPAGARVTLDGVAVQPPIEVKPSDEVASIAIAAPGFEPYEMELVLDKTQIVEIEMKKIAGKKKKSKKGKKRPKKKSPSKKSGGQP
jgi:serine/threonine-protein kinase